MIAHASAKSEVRRAKHTFHAESAAEGGTRAQLRTPPRGCSGKLNVPAMPSRPQKEVCGDDHACRRDTWGKVRRADHACRAEKTTEGGTRGQSSTLPLCSRVRRTERICCAVPTQVHGKGTTRKKVRGDEDHERFKN